MKCPFCKHKINRYDGKHIYNCASNKKFDRKADIKYQYLLYNHPFISVKNNLFVEYVVKNKSLPDIRKEYGISYNNAIFLLDLFEIKRRDMRTSSKTISVKKYKKTCLEKYGKDNFSKIKKNIKKNNFDTIINNNKSLYEQIKDMVYSQKTDILKKALERDNILKKETSEIYKKYYAYWNNLNDEEKNKLINKGELLENKISNCLDKLNVTYMRNFTFSRMKFDFKINNNILIDVNSDFWKANPLYYRENDKMNFPFKKIVAKKIWQKDESKNRIMAERGYRVIVLWESDFKNLNDDELLSFLTKKMNFTQL